MYPEKRKEERTSFKRQPRGRLHVLAGDQSHPVIEVMDMSPMGIRCRVDARVAIGENVLIRYQAEGVDLKLNGTVIWNSDSTPAAASDANRNGCIIGVQLTSPSLLQAFW